MTWPGSPAGATLLSADPLARSLVTLVSLRPVRSHHNEGGPDSLVSRP